jgi:hypothetical protein
MNNHPTLGIDSSDAEAVAEAFATGLQAGYDQRDAEVHGGFRRLRPRIGLTHAGRPRLPAHTTRRRDRKNVRQMLASRGADDWNGFLEQGHRAHLRAVA